MCNCSGWEPPPPVGIARFDFGTLLQGTGEYVLCVRLEAPDTSRRALALAVAIQLQRVPQLSTYNVGCSNLAVPMHLRVFLTRI